MTPKSHLQTLWKAFASPFRRVGSSNSSATSFFLSVLAVTLAYRVLLTVTLFTSPVRPFDFDPTHRPFWFMVSFVPWDLGLAAVCFIVTWFLSRLPSLLRPGLARKCLGLLGWVLLHAALVGIPFIHGGHARLLFNAQTGLDTFVIIEAISSVSWLELAKMIQLRDSLFFLVPVGLFWLIRLSPEAFRVRSAAVSFSVFLSLSIAAWVGVGAGRGDVPAEIRLNPAWFLLSDVAENTLLRPTAGIPDRNASSSRRGLGPRRGVSSYKPPRDGRPWNVVFFVMESAGARYVFDTSDGLPMPMPFLRDLASQGWYLKKHYASSNLSTKALFSLLSGRYDLFSREAFGLRQDAGVPSVYSFVGRDHDTFLVTPSSLAWYFPRPFVRNSGLKEIHSYENLNFGIKEEFHTLGHYIAREESQTVDFFLQRLTRAKEPFFGIYVSFAAHFPYFDYGPEYRVRHDDGRSISRYYNNLNLLNRMLKRVYDHLAAQGLLERTIFVIVGDHGQAFGQHHPDNFMHYRYSYNENLEAPAVLWQPALFPPREVTFPTSHVDLLPTLLDALNVAYDPALLDGESLFQEKPGHDYVFAYGYEGALASISADGIKVHYSLKKNQCEAFDLGRDPEERTPLDCSLFASQLETLRAFARRHNDDLVQYSAAFREGKDYNGHRHPFIAEEHKGQKPERAERLKEKQKDGIGL